MSHMCLPYMMFDSNTNHNHFFFFLQHTTHTHTYKTPPPTTPFLTSWGKKKALVEILLLSGGTPYANFKDLAHAWGREKGFHHVLAQHVCERRGEVERKRRSDVGKTLSVEQKETFRQKLKKSRPTPSIVPTVAATATTATATNTATYGKQMDEGDNGHHHQQQQQHMTEDEEQTQKHHHHQQHQQQFLLHMESQQIQLQQQQQQQQQPIPQLPIEGTISSHDDGSHMPVDQQQAFLEPAPSSASTILANATHNVQV